MITITPTTASLFSKNTERMRRPSPPWLTTSPPPGSLPNSWLRVSRSSRGPVSPTIPVPACSSCVTRTRSSGFCIADPRIDDRVENVGQQVAGDGRDGHDEGDAQQGREVLPKGRIDGEKAHAGVVEDTLGDHGAADDGPEGQPQERDDRDDGVAQRMDVEDPTRSGALGAGRPHEVLR